jgi:hypothetical protein
MAKNKAAVLDSITDEVSIDSMKKISGGAAVHTAVMPNGGKMALLDGAMLDHNIGSLHETYEKMASVSVDASTNLGNGASASASAGAEAGASASVTIDSHGISAGAEAHVGADAGVSVGVHVGPVDASAHAGAGVEAGADASISVGDTHVNVGVNVGAHAGVDAGGNVGVGDGSGNHVGQGGSVNAGVHADAGGNGNVDFGDGKYGLGGKGGAEAGAGVGAEANVSVGVGGVVDASGSAGVSIGAQAGASGEGHAGYDDGKINIGFEGDVKLIGGIHLDIDLSIDTKPIQNAAETVANGAVDAANTVADGAKDAANAVADTAVDVGNTIADGAKDAAEAVGDALNPGRVICTHFYRKGMLDRETWRADLEFTYSHLSPTTVRGYQYWAIPYVRLMRRSKLAEKIMYPLARHRALELAYKMGRAEKGSLFGKIVRHTLEPVCFLIGSLVGEQNWAPLWVGTELEQKTSA